MSLVRTWTGGVCRASAAAMIAPVAVIAALALLALAGGFGRIGAIGQIVSGPALPATAHPLSLPSRQRGAAALIGGTRVSTHTAVGRTRAGRFGASAPSVPRVGGGGRPGGIGISGSDGSAATSAPSGAPGPPPSSAPGSTVVQSLVRTGGAVTQSLPGPVGGAATQTLQRVGSTAGGLLPRGSRIATR